MTICTRLSRAPVWIALGLLAACTDAMELDGASVDAAATIPDAASVDIDATAQQADALAGEPDAARSEVADAAPPVDAAPPPSDANPADDGIPQATNVVPIVAPSVCTPKNQHLLKCGFGPRTFAAPAVGPGDYKTVVTAHELGDCSSTLPIEVLLSADGIEPFTYVLFLNEKAVLRRDDSAALGAIVVSRDSALANVPAYALSCRVWLEVEFNVPIVAGQP